MHWVIAFHENDFKMRSIIRSLRQDCYEMDPKMLEKYNLCKCNKVARPNIKELRFLELDIPEPAAQSFQNKLDDIGFRPFHPPFGFKFLLKKFVKIFGGKDVEMEVGNEETSHRYNNRSLILFKSHDDPVQDNKDVIECQACKGVFPRDWL